MEALGTPPEPLPMARLGRARVARLLLALGVVTCWLGLELIDLVLSVMFFSEPNPEILLYASPMLAVVPWIVTMANARGRVITHADFIEIRHRRVLREPIFLRRSDITKILLDDGSTTGRPRFPTGDPVEPLLWTDPVPRKQHGDRPLIGDGILPNVAVVLAEPLPMKMARSALSAVPVDCEISPPKRSGKAKALLLAMEDLNAVRAALVGWPVEEASHGVAIPVEVGEAAARVEGDAAIFVAVAAATAAFVVAAPALVPIPFCLSIVVVWRRVARRQRAEAAARAEVAGRIEWQSPEERATALAVIDANFGPARSEGPPV